jgi:hypothetical protein
MTSSTHTPHHILDADRSARRSSPSSTRSSIHPATASVRSALPVTARKPARPVAAGGIWSAAVATFRALAETARLVGNAWQAAATKDALVEEHRDRVRTQIHQFGGRY